MKETRRTDLFLIAGTALVFIVVALFAPLEKALATAVTFGVFAAIVQTKWESRNDGRFWAVIAFLALDFLGASCAHRGMIG